MPPPHTEGLADISLNEVTSRSRREWSASARWRSGPTGHGSGLGTSAAFDAEASGDASTTGGALSLVRIARFAFAFCRFVVSALQRFSVSRFGVLAIQVLGLWEHVRFAISRFDVLSVAVQRFGVSGVSLFCVYDFVLRFTICVLRVGLVLVVRAFWKSHSAFRATHQGGASPNEVIGGGGISFVRGGCAEEVGSRSEAGGGWRSDPSGTG